MSDAAFSRRVEILLVEDNPGDVRPTEETITEFKVLNQLSVVGDAIDSLSVKTVLMRRSQLMATLNIHDIVGQVR